MADGQEPRFRLKAAYGRRNPPRSLREIMEVREYSHYGQGQMEDMQDAIGNQFKLLTSLLIFMMDKGIVTAEEVCRMVNMTSGYVIEVAGEEEF